MGVNINSPVSFSPPAQLSPAGVNGGGNYIINSFAGIQLNNVNGSTLQVNGLQVSLWMSNAASAGVGNGPYQCQSSAQTFPVAFNLILSVNIIKFDVMDQDGQALLSWVSSSEHNNKEFIIQRKIDNDNFQDILITPTLAPAGSSLNDLTYQVLLPEALKNNTYYYRIETVGLDGLRSYSDIKSLKGKNTRPFLSIYPNPSTDGNAFLLLPNNAGLSDIVINDLSGRAVQNWKNVSTSAISLHGLQPGTYFVKVWFLSLDKIITEKLIVGN
jgi:hypothetical protein